jgi:hypothetical protein
VSWPRARPHHLSALMNHRLSLLGPSNSAYGLEQAKCPCSHPGSVLKLDQQCWPSSEPLPQGDTLRCKRLSWLLSAVRNRQPREGLHDVALAFHDNTTTKVRVRQSCDRFTQFLRVDHRF